SSPAQASARMLGERLRRMEISGTLALYGVADVGLALEVERTLTQEYGFRIAPDQALPMTDEMRYTKDPEEIEITRRLGRITCGIMGRLRDYLASLTPRNGAAHRPDGTPAVLGDLRRIVRLG